jgi:hypothetical protein
MITNEQQLNYALSEPSAALIARMKEIDGDIMILGAGGKVGPSLAVMAKKAAAAAKRISACMRCPVLRIRMSLSFCARKAWK